MGFPPQKLSFRSKNRKWRSDCIDWADNNYLLYNSYTRKSYHNKIINYNLINGILDMEDMAQYINPYNLITDSGPEKVQHFPIIDSKLNVLKGEEFARRYDFRAIVTNPEAVTEIVRAKQEQLMSDLQNFFLQDVQSEEEQQREIEKLSDYYKYNWKDIREVRVNYLLKHYWKELDFDIKFNDGFMDAMAVGEEIYQADIVGGEPTFERLNPKKIKVMRSGFSNRIEDADMILYWDYWSPGKIQDTFYDVLTPNDVKRISDMGSQFSSDTMDNYDDNRPFVPIDLTDGEGTVFNSKLGLFGTSMYGFANYTDNFGNIRVLRLYWKSYRQIKKVKSYDPETGEEVYNFYPETYIINKDLGEEEQILYINEAWEGTKIGKDMYVNMRPKIVQYNRMSNPSRCHFGIVGSIYNLNESKPYSLVDMMKPYNYLYNAVHDKMIKLMAANWGKSAKVDFASLPDGWKFEQWLFHVKTSHVAAYDSFKEGNKGMSTGKLSGQMNNQGNGVLDFSQGQEIQFHMNLLEWIKQTMSEMVGITRQREGAINNRETVGGVERSVLQSSHITEWLFLKHDNVKKRALECFIETAKAALKGRQMKFQYLLSDGTAKIIDIDGDEFSENDYGIVVDSSKYSQDLAQKLEGLAQAMVQNGTISMSSMIKIFTDTSIADISRTIQEDEQKRQQQQQENIEADRQAQMEQAQMGMQMEQEKLLSAERQTTETNETKLLIAQLQAEAAQLAQESVADQDVYDPQKQADLQEKIREFNQKLQLDRDKFNLEKSNSKEELRLKEKQINKQTVSKSNTKK